MLGKIKTILGNHVAGEALLNSLKGALGTLLGGESKSAHSSAGMEVLTKGIGGLFSSKDESEIDFLLSSNFSHEERALFWDVVDKLSDSSYALIRVYVRNKIFQHFLIRTVVRVKGSVETEVIEEDDLKVPKKSVEKTEVLHTTRDERVELITSWIEAARDKGVDAFVTEVERQRLVPSAKRIEAQLRRIPMGRAIASIGGATQRAKKEGADVLKQADRIATVIFFIGTILFVTGTGIINVSTALILSAGIIIAKLLYVIWHNKTFADAKEEEK